MKGALIGVLIVGVLFIILACLLKQTKFFISITLGIKKHICRYYGKTLPYFITGVFMVLAAVIGLLIVYVCNIHNFRFTCTIEANFICGLILAFVIGIVSVRLLGKYDFWYKKDYCVEQKREIDKESDDGDILEDKEIEILLWGTYRENRIFRGWVNFTNGFLIILALSMVYLTFKMKPAENMTIAAIALSLFTISVNFVSLQKSHYFDSLSLYLPYYYDDKEKLGELLKEINKKDRKVSRDSCIFYFIGILAGLIFVFYL